MSAFCIIFASAKRHVTLITTHTKMRKHHYHWLGVATLLVLTLSCGEKKKESDVIIAKKVEQKVPKSIQGMSEYIDSRQTEWVGSVYTVEVKRRKDPSLPVVTLGDKTRYYDNRISVKVIRKDGSVFFNKDFTKADFSGHLDAHTQEQGALLGVVFVKAEGNDLLFAASVGSPDMASDEYVPLVVRLSRMGNISITQDTILDTENE